MPDGGGTVELPDRICLGHADKRQRDIVERAWTLIEPVCSAEGLELVHVEFQRESSGRIFRLYIDKPGGVSIDDCSRVSRQVSDLLDVGLDDIGPYRLEVSSPGIHRPIGKISDFSRFIGHRAKIRFRRTIDDRKQMTGVLADTTATGVILDMNGDRVEIAFDDIARAQLADPINLPSDSRSRRS